MSKAVTLRNRMKTNIYNAYIRGMSKSELARAFQKSPATIGRWIEEKEQESLRDKSRYEEDLARAVHIDRIDEAIASAYALISSKGIKASEYLNGLNVIKGLLELRARVEGLLAQRLTGPDGKGPIEITAVADRGEAIREITRRIEQAQLLEMNHDD